VSYVPAALNHGAELYTGLRARRVLLESGRAVGVEAESTWTGRRVRIRARAVVLSGGAVPSPLLLLSQGLANSSGQVGCNLSIHPGTAVSALFDEPILAYQAIPQGYGCDQFHREGILLLGASAPLNIGAAMFSLNGRALMDAMEAYDRVASFGVMVEDEGRGRVRRGPRGRPLLTYWLKPADVARLHSGMIHVAEIYLAAGAKKIFPLMPDHPAFEGEAGLKRFREARLRPWSFFLTSFHPLGTCRMGRDAKASVVDLDHQAHDVPGLFVVDGSALPGPPAVNPQLTIMALATRAAERIGERLS
jgi:choline dehydrogenase-like flavoprotein